MKTGEERVERRDFLKTLAWTGLGATAAGGVVPLGGVLLPPQEAARRGPSRISLGPIGEFPSGTARMAILQGEPVIVVRGEEGVSAFASRCPHLGCLVGWDEAARQIRCPCHGGRFDTEGRVIAGPPPGPLVPIPVSIEGGEVWIGA